MAYQLFWSWIFISLIRPALALPVNPNYDVLAKRAVDSFFIPEFSQDNQTRTKFTAVVITVTIVFVAVITGIVLTVRRNTKRKMIEEPEAGLVIAVKPIFEPEKARWWRNFRWPIADSEYPEGTRIQRIKQALGKNNKEPILPLHNASSSLPSPPANLQPQYPDLLERRPKVPLDHPSQEVLTEKPQPRSPPKAIVTHGAPRKLVRSDRRGLPNSPKAWRKSRMSRGSLRHPFLPLNGPEIAPSALKTAGVDVSKSHFTHKLSLLRLVPEYQAVSGPIRSAPLLRPSPLDLDEKTAATCTVWFPYGCIPCLLIRTSFDCQCVVGLSQ